MGIAGSKDETGTVVLGSLPPGFLDPKGRRLRDELDACLQQNMWYFSLGGLLLVAPICIKYKTERPFFVAAVTCPFADMYYGTLRCTKENEAFREHYKQLQLAFSQPAGQQQHQQWRPPEQPQDAQAPSSGWRPPPDEQRWQPRQQLQQEGGGYQPQAQPQPKRWWWG